MQKFQFFQSSFRLFDYFSMKIFMYQYRHSILKVQSIQILKKNTEAKVPIGNTAVFYQCYHCYTAIRLKFAFCLSLHISEI